MEKIMEEMPVILWHRIISIYRVVWIYVIYIGWRRDLSGIKHDNWLRQLRQEATDSVDLKSLTNNTVRQEEKCIVELLPSGKKEMVAPEFIQEDETAGKSEGDSLKISIGDIDIYAGSDTSEELLAGVIRVIRHV